MGRKVTGAHGTCRKPPLILMCHQLKKVLSLYYLCPFSAGSTKLRDAFLEEMGRNNGVFEG